MIEWGALIAALFGGGLLTRVAQSLFERRKTDAEAELTSGKAWAEFVQTQAVELRAEIANLRTDNAALKGELKAARMDIRMLERRERAMLKWQAQVTAREEMVAPQLQHLGVTVPPMPEPPDERTERTRATDETE